MECHEVPGFNYTDFSIHLYYKARAKRIPVSVGIEITSRCNNKCVHCYILPAGDQEQELTYKEICRIIDEVVDEGCLWFLVSGGEPLLRPDFLDIYLYAKKKGLLITIFTNGTLITPKIADYLQRWPPRRVEITLYGMTRQTYGSVTGMPSNFDRCMKGIQLLLERRIHILLKAMILTLNKHEIWQMKKFAEERGVEFGYDAEIHPRLDGSKKPCDFMISPEETVEFDLADEERLEQLNKFAQKSEVPAIETDSLYTCGAGRDSCYIDSFGKLRLCVSHMSPSYNLRRGFFRDGWYNFFPKILAQKPSVDNECTTCKLKSLCGQCPAWSQLVHGDLETKVEHLCQLAHLRAEALKLKDPELWALQVATAE